MPEISMNLILIGVPERAPMLISFAVLSSAINLGRGRGGEDINVFSPPGRRLTPRDSVKGILSDGALSILIFHTITSLRYRNVDIKNRQLHHIN